MELKDFKQQISNFPKGKEFNYGISKPFSWRGSYDEVAFSIIESPMKREEILENIELAYTEIFYGYKGGEYRYNDHTYIHFETDCSSWSDGEYVSRWIVKIEGGREYHSQEDKLVKLSFS